MAATRTGSATAIELAGLARYRARRNFARTAEPAGTGEAAADARFVVQKHAARRLHYDLRLEIDGVFKSWAVTRGPSLDPKDRRLAIHVEDHPLAYGTFEGTIPQGEYGGGTVMVWDAGTWAPDTEPAAAYAAGRLKFQLAGTKLKGGWTLVRMSGRREKQDPWLLVKEQDATARVGRGALPDDDRSVLSGRSMAEIGAKALAVGPARPMPRFVPPQLATPASELPVGAGWIYEIKHDGYRCQLHIEGGTAAVLTRNGHDWTARFAALAEAARALPVAGAMIDGEAVVLDPRGASSFALLRQALDEGGGIVCYVFDLLFLDGQDLRSRPLLERKARLKDLLAGTDGCLRYSDHLKVEGEGLLQRACALGAEGLIAKRADGSYRSGRSAGWLKIKCHARQEVVIGGYTPMGRGETGLGALLVGTYDGDRLVYAGKVGTGWDEAQQERILAALGSLRCGTMPFADVPAPARRVARWVAPELVVEVRFRDWTADGRLRHATWLGLREGRAAASVRREAGPVSTSWLEHGGVRLTHPDRVVLAQPPVTKGDLWRYYREVADRVLPGIVGRPLSVIRCPSGVEGGCFFQRHRTEGMPAAIRALEIAAGQGAERYFAIDGLEGLLALVQFGTVELHPWGARAGRPDRPDRLIFDLDPAERLPWARVVEAALELRERLRALRLESFPRTTGGKGLHVVLPIERRHDWPAAKAFAAGIARAMAEDSPSRYTASLAKAARRGRVFIDYLRNEDGATAVASYSVRARPGAAVAMPLAWGEVVPALDPKRFTLASVPGLLAGRGDPWAGMAKLRQRLPKAASSRRGADA